MRCEQEFNLTYLLHHRTQETSDARAPRTRRKGLVRILQFSIQAILRLLCSALASLGPRRRIGPASLSVVLFGKRLLDNVVVG